MDYIEENPDLQVTYTWHNTHTVYHITTHKGTLVELVDRPVWGLSCFMDRVVQSCEKDEQVYHRALVEPVLKHLRAGTDLRVCILGGGEGATAREVLACERVSKVDMIEWDHDIVELFSTRFKQWGRGAWDDERLVVSEADAFIVCEETRSYDAVIVDMFEPEDTDRWYRLLERVCAWARGCVAVYVGTHAPNVVKRSKELTKMRKVIRGMGFTTHLSSAYVPSFQGHAVFLLAKKV